MRASKCTNKGTKPDWVHASLELCKHNNKGKCVFRCTERSSVHQRRPTKGLKPSIAVLRHYSALERLPPLLYIVGIAFEFSFKSVGASIGSIAAIDYKIMYQHIHSQYYKKSLLYSLKRVSFRRVKVSTLIYGLTK